MNARSNIPVVIMGETGCGKTRLIRYMCDLQAFGSGRQNMLMMKVSKITTRLKAMPCSEGSWWDH